MGSSATILDKDPDAAIDACGRIIVHGQIKGGYSVVVAYAHRGQAFENKGDFDRAVADFSDAIRLRPYASGYLVLRGDASEKSGKVEVAEADYRQAAKIDPKNQDAANDLKRIQSRSAASSPGGTVPALPVVTASAQVRNPRRRHRRFRHM